MGKLPKLVGVYQFLSFLGSPEKFFALGLAALTNFSEPLDQSKMALCERKAAPRQHVVKNGRNTNAIGII
jgi:hypothetical protein